MGVYIKGMEMPNGFEMLVVFSDGTVHKCLPGMREHVEKGTAVPVPTHGRLIDADAIPERYSEVRDLAPTIIPAEEKE